MKYSVKYLIRKIVFICIACLGVVWVSWGIIEVVTDKDGGTHPVTELVRQVELWLWPAPPPEPPPPEPPKPPTTPTTTTTTTPTTTTPTTTMPTTLPNLAPPPIPAKPYWIQKYTKWIDDKRWTYFITHNYKCRCYKTTMGKGPFNENELSVFLKMHEGLPFTKHEDCIICGGKTVKP